LIERTIRGVERGQIPAGQYHAVLIDEGHDFRPEWLQLATQMVDPETNDLLVMLDGAQSVHERGRTRAFSFKSVGIQAQGRTTVLRVNYRSTRQILHTARQIAGDLVNADGNGQNEDAIPLIAPLSCDHDGPEPIVIQLPSPLCEAMKICELLCAAHEEGHRWKDMAVLCGDHLTMEQTARVMVERMLPHRVCRGPEALDPEMDRVKVMTMEASTGLEFEVVALIGQGLGGSNALGQAAAQARLRYVAASRSTRRLVVAASDSGNWEVVRPRGN